jgi:hypothetical protein
MPNGVNTKLAALLDKIDALNATVTDLNENVIGIASNLGTYMVASLSAMEATAAATEQIADTTGIAAGGPTTTLASLAIEIASLLHCAPRACAPGPDDAEGCQEPLISVGQVTSSDYTGRVFATWLEGSLPDGLTEGAFLAHDVDNAQIVHEATTGWKAYVKSNGASSYSINPDAAPMLSTNQWNDIDTYQDMAFNVPDGADIVVYLCNPTLPPFVDCIEIDSVVGTYISEQPVGTVNFTELCQCIAYDAIPSVTCATRQEYATTPISSEGFDDVDCSVYTNNANGFTITLISGTAPVLVIWISDTGARDFATLDSISDTVNIGVDTSGFIILNTGVDSPSTHPFTVQICPGA